MPRGQRATGDIVAHDARHFRNPRDMDVDEDNGNRRRTKGDSVLGRRWQRNDEQTVGPLRLRQGAEVVIPLFDRLHVVDREVELLVRKDGVDAAKSFRGLWPGEERDDHAGGERSAEAQSPRSVAWGEAELVDDSKNPRARLRIDDPLVVERAGCGRDAYSRAPGYVTDVDRLLHYHPRRCNRLHETGSTRYHQRQGWKCVFPDFSSSPATDVRLRKLRSRGGRCWPAVFMDALREFHARSRRSD